jgi:hypothetical protein
MSTNHAAPWPVVHLELHTPDRAAAGAFYARLLHWRPELIEARVGSYLSLDLGGGSTNKLNGPGSSARGCVANFVSFSGWNVSHVTASSCISCVPFDFSASPGCGPCGKPDGCGVIEPTSTVPI